MKGYEDVRIDTGDLVFHQYEDKKAWLGPEGVFAVKGGYVTVSQNLPQLQVRCLKLLKINSFICDHG